MKKLRAAFIRFLGLFHRRQHEAEMNAELQAHLDGLTERNIAKGMSPEEARYAALREFGGAEQIKESARDQRRTAWGENLARDLRFAVRQLWKTPGFTTVAVLTLALGIGATTAIFSVLNAVILRPLAFSRPGELVAVQCVIPVAAHLNRTVNARFYTEWRTSSGFSDLALFSRWTATLIGSGEPARLTEFLTTPNLLHTLRVVPALGRDFSASDAEPGQPPEVVLISHRLWRERFASDPSIIGRSLVIDSKPRTVIGVMPAGFRVPDQGWDEPDIFMPLAFGAAELADILGRFNYDVIGRLAPGVSLDQAKAQLNVTAARLCQLAGGKTEVRASLSPLHETIVGPVRRGAWILFGATTAVLLLACLNLGLLGLARAERRSHESAVRSALGASRGRLFAHALAESLVLSAMGGVFGCLFGSWSLHVLTQLASANLPRLENARLDLPVLAFALGTTVLTTVLAGLVPAWHHARSDASAVYLSRNGRTSTGSPAGRRLRTTLIAIQIAVGTLLLTAAALLIASFVRVMQADIGFRAPQVLTTDLMIPGSKYRSPADRRAYFDRVIAAVSALPQVSSAAVTNVLPLTGEVWVDSLSVPGDTRPRFERPQANVRFVSPDYFSTLGIPLLAGRAFRASDGVNAIIVSAQIAASLWPGQDPVGRKALPGDLSEELEVIGVVGDVRADVERHPAACVYCPHWAYPFAQAALAIRFDGPVVPPLSAVRDAIHQVDAEVPVQGFKTMDALFDSAVTARRFQMRLIAAFALSALTLAALGLYGVVAHSVGQRRRELGIRLTFGAPPAELLAMVMRQSLRPVLFGLLAGLAASVATGSLLTSFLYKTNARDPRVFAIVVAVMLPVALVACLLPARRVAKIDPMVALRAE